MEKHIGEVLNDRYMITEVIGVGGMAYVYKAFDKVCNRVVAVKILKDEFMSDAQFRRRFTNESKAITMLSHDNIVDVYDVSLEGDSLYIVMEYIDGITLKEYISQKGILSDTEALHFIKQILNGLAHAHERGIVHRDIKPHNIILLKDGTIKITDFGIARLTKFDTQTISDQTIGSVHYISPEQASGDRTDERSDIYSVGIILYEMLSGKLPFEADTAVAVALMQVQSQPDLPSELNADLKQGLEDITLKAIMKDPSVRYQSAGAMLADIAQYEADPSVVFNYISGEVEAPTFVEDNSPTIFAAGGVEAPIPPVAPIPPIPEVPSAEDLLADEEYEEEPKNRFLYTGLPIIGGIFSAIAILAIVAICIAFQLELFGEKPIDCPKVIGMTVDEAEGKYGGFKFEVTEEKAHASAPAGEIIEQSPADGAEIKRGDTIYVIISNGKTSAIPDGSNENSTVSGDNYVPSLVGLNKSAAAEKLKDNGFASSDYDWKYTESDAPKGEVVKVFIYRDGREISARPGDELYDGDTMHIYLSEGPDKVKVPDLIGMTKKQAEEALKNVGLKIKVVEKESDEPVGEVFDYDHKGEEVEVGTVVEVEISKGPGETSKLKVVPDLIGETAEDAEGMLKSAGFTSKDYVIKNIVDENTDVGSVAKLMIYRNGSEIIAFADDEMKEGDVLYVYVSVAASEDTETDTGTETEPDTEEAV